MLRNVSPRLFEFAIADTRSGIDICRLTKNTVNEIFTLGEARLVRRVVKRKDVRYISDFVRDRFRVVRSPGRKIIN